MKINGISKKKIALLVIIIGLLAMMLGIYVVKNSEQSNQINPFDEISIEYSGVSGSAMAKVIRPDNNPAYEEIIYTISKDYDIVEGEEIVVTASLENPYGKMLSQTTKVFTATKLDRYITSASEITEDDMEKIVGGAEEIVLLNNQMVYSIELVGNIFRSIKDVNNMSYYNKNNYLSIVHKITINDTESQEEIEYYYVVEYDTILEKGNGELEINLSRYTIYKHEFSVGKFMLYGFQSIEELIKELVTDKQEVYRIKKNL